MRQLLSDRYLSGQHEQVWDELMALGGQVRVEPNRVEAEAVARETMARVRANVTRLYFKLDEIGYEFVEPDQAFVRPPANVREQIRALEALTGPLPLSLRAWYEVVGSVNFMGAYPGLASNAPGPFSQAPDFYTDPLVVYPIEYARSEVQNRFLPESGQFLIPISPDQYHKANVSGGAPYEMLLSNTAADGLLLNESHEINFVPYLRLVFRWGGFPGLAGMSERPEALLEKLTLNLVPI